MIFFKLHTTSTGCNEECHPFPASNVIHISYKYKKYIQKSYKYQKKSNKKYQTNMIKTSRKYQTNIIRRQWWTTYFCRLEFFSRPSSTLADLMSATLYIFNLLSFSNKYDQNTKKYDTNIKQDLMQLSIFLLWRFSTMVALVSRSGTSLHMPLMIMVAGLAKRVGGFHLLVNYFRFGGEGNLEDWWSNNTATEFHSRAECLVRTNLLLYICSQFSIHL